MGHVEKSIEVEAPIHEVYNQWTQFESFPQFMEGVESITQLGDARTHWVIKAGGATREFDADITEQEPDQRVAWRSVSGPTHAGVVTFHRLGEATTRVMVQLDLDPEGLLETAGDKLGIVGHRLEGDLKRFKTFIESLPAETGEWRGEVEQDPTT